MERTLNLGGCLFGIGALLLVVTLCIGIPLSNNGANELPLPIRVVGTILVVGAAIGLGLGTLLSVVGLIGTSVSGGGSTSSSSYSPATSSESLTERIQRAGMDAAWVTSDGRIHYMSFSGPVGHVTASGEVYLDVVGHAGRVRSDGVVERNGIGPVLTVHADGSITGGGSYFANARPAMNRIHAGAGALALLIYVAAAR